MVSPGEKSISTIGDVHVSAISRRLSMSNSSDSTNIEGVGSIKLLSNKSTSESPCNRISSSKSFENASRISAGDYLNMNHDSSNLPGAMRTYQTNVQTSFSDERQHYVNTINQSRVTHKMSNEQIPGVIETPRRDNNSRNSSNLIMQDNSPNLRLNKKNEQIKIDYPIKSTETSNNLPFKMLHGRNDWNADRLTNALQSVSAVAAAPINAKHFVDSVHLGLNVNTRVPATDSSTRSGSAPPSMRNNQNRPSELKTHSVSVASDVSYHTNSSAMPSSPKPTTLAQNRNNGINARNVSNHVSTKLHSSSSTVENNRHPDPSNLKSQSQFSVAPPTSFTAENPTLAGFANINSPAFAKGKFSLYS